MIITREILKIMKKPQPSNFNMCAECWKMGEDEAIKERDQEWLSLLEFDENIKSLEDLKREEFGIKDGR